MVDVYCCPCGRKGETSMTTQPTSKWERFPNAPITEALLDIRAHLPGGVGLAELASLHDEIKNVYPMRRERQRWQGGIHFDKGAPPRVDEGSVAPDGYLFTSADGKRIVQARLDGFTFNWLAKYDTWSLFRDEAKAHWDRYRERARPEALTRIALRYLNRILLPLPIKDFKDYVLTVPEIAPELPQELTELFMRVVLPFPAQECRVIVTQTIESQNGDRLPWILDIDAFVEKAFSVEGQEVWDVFERLHDAKNKVFFKSLTERTKEFFR
jgi:uncharacterized protein (TIGR04255 family)